MSRRTDTLIPFEERKYRRNEIWWTDFGSPTGHEIADIHPSVIVSRQEFNDVASRLGWLIVVPATSTRITVPRTNRIPLTHLGVQSSEANGLKHESFFLCEQVRCVSTTRLKSQLGMLESTHMREIEQRLCLVMDLFKR